MNPPIVHQLRRQGSLEIVRHPEGPIEIRLAGVIGAFEQRMRRWRTVALTTLVGLCVAASLAVVVLALRWDYQRGRTLRALQTDLEVAEARGRCWEALTRYAPPSHQEAIAPARRSDWVRQCVATELTRRNPRR